MRPSPRVASWFALALVLAQPAEAVELAPGDIVAVEPGRSWRRSRLLRIDPESGATEVISHGSFFDWAQVAVDPDGQIFVNGGGVARVDATTGEVDRLYTSTYGFGGSCIDGLAIEPTGDLVLACGGRVVRIDPESGVQTVVSEGVFLNGPSGIDVLPDGDLLVVDWGLGVPPGSIVRVDPVTGAQSLLAHPTLAGVPMAIAVAPGGRAYFGEWMTGAGLVRLDVSSGAQTVVAGVAFPMAIAAEPRGTLVVATPTRILRVNPDSGRVRLITPLSVTGLAVVPEPTLEVVIETRPRNLRRRLQAGSRGAIHVAVFGSDELEVGDILLESLALGPTRARAAGDAEIGDLDQDGWPELLLKFWIDETGVEPDDTEICLTGLTASLRRLEGCDPLDPALR